MTAGTKYAEMRSARFWMSGWRDWASLTVWTICWSAVSAPTFVASTTRDTVLVNGGPDDLVALTFLDGDGLAGDHRLVNSALPVDDDAVGRDLFAGTDLHAVAHGDILQWHFHFDTVLVDEGGRLGLHFEEFSKGVTCLPFQAGFEIVAERDEHEDQRGSVEVQTPAINPANYRDW